MYIDIYVDTHTYMQIDAHKRIYIFFCVHKHINIHIYYFINQGKEMAYSFPGIVYEYLIIS